jgi:hypothetical protein
MFSQFSSKVQFHHIPMKITTILVEVYLVIALSAVAFSACSDYFRVEFELLAHDKIQVRLSRKTAIAFRDHGVNQPTSFTTYLVRIFIHMHQCDGTGWGGSITNSDYNEAAQFIIDGFAFFKMLVNEMENDQELENIYILLRRSWTWSDFDPNEAMSFKNQLETEC